MQTDNLVKTYKISSVFRLMRVHQWVKNLFVFLPIFFAGKILDVPSLISTAVGFIAFSLTASSIYVINDYVDIEKDRLHPEKKNRPLASGELSQPQGLVIFFALLAISITISLQLSYQLIMILGIYFFMNLAYSFKLKHIPIIDVTIISVGFLLRVIVGGVAANVLISKWIVLLTFLLAMILAFAKRRGEFSMQAKGVKTRKSLEGYSLHFIDMSIVFMTAITVVSYIMYTVSVEVVERIGSDYVYFTTIFVLMGVLRYLQQTIVFNKTESPTKVLYKDKFIQIVLLLWILSFALLIYGKSYF